MILTVRSTEAVIAAEKLTGMKLYSNGEQTATCEPRVALQVFYCGYMHISHLRQRTHKSKIFNISRLSRSRAQIFKITSLDFHDFKNFQNIKISGWNFQDFQNSNYQDLPGFETKFSGFQDLQNLRNARIFYISRFWRS